MKRALVILGLMLGLGVSLSDEEHARRYFTNCVVAKFAGQAVIDSVVVVPEGNHLLAYGWGHFQPTYEYPNQTWAAFVTYPVSPINLRVLPK